MQQTVKPSKVHIVATVHLNTASLAIYYGIEGWFCPPNPASLKANL